MPSLELESMGGSCVVCVCKILHHNHLWSFIYQTVTYELTNVLGPHTNIYCSIYLPILVSVNKDIPTLLMVLKTVSEAPAAVKRLSRLGPA